MEYQQIRPDRSRYRTSQIRAERHTLTAATRTDDLRDALDKIRDDDAY
jgi:hypothetical protein